METRDFYSAVEIFYSENVSVTNSRLVGGPSVNGIPQDAEPGTPNPTGSIIGLPTARAMTVRESDGVVIENTEITEFRSGIVGISAHDLKILSSELHDLRTTALAGKRFPGSGDGRKPHPYLQPWKLGGVGDHADFIHPWTSAAQTDAERRTSPSPTTFSRSAPASRSWASISTTTGTRSGTRTS